MGTPYSPSAALPTGQSGEVNSQWDGRPCPSAGGSRRRLDVQNLSPDGFLPPQAASRAGTPALLMLKKLEKFIHPIAAAPRIEGLRIQSNPCYDLRL